MFTIGVGQCGVQVSGEFWSQVHREGAVNKVGPSLPSISGLPDGEGASSDPLFSKYCDDGRSLRAEESTQRPATRRTGDLFDQSGKARALFVDSEPKVVESLLEGAPPPFLPVLDESACLVEQCGRGNVWSWGYNLPARQHRRPEVPLWSRTMATLRRKMEACDEPLPIVVLHSIGGGTGSGLGSRIADLIHDEYPRRNLLSVVVAPFHVGDTPLQHYNSLFTLAHIQESSDGILFFSNDDILQRAKLAKCGGDARKAESARVSTADMNTVLSQTLVQLLFPSVKLPASKAAPRESPSRHALPDVADPTRDRSTIEDVIRSTVVAPQLKFLDVRSDYVYIDTMLRPTGRRPGTAGQVRSAVADLLKQEGGDESVGPASKTDQTLARVAGVKQRSESVTRGRRVDAGSLSSYSHAAKSTAAAVHKPVSTDSSKSTDVATKKSTPSTMSATRSRSKPHVPERQPTLKIEEWSTLATRLAASLPRRRNSGKRIKYVAAKIYARGAEINDLCAAAVSEAASSKVPTWPGLPTGGDWQAVNRLLADALNFTHASSSKHSYTLDAAVFGGQGFVCSGRKRSLLLCSNSDAINDHLLHVLDRSSEMFQSKAYVHWYTRYGCEESDFVDAFYNLSSVVRNYAAATSEPTI